MALSDRPWPAACWHDARIIHQAEAADRRPLRVAAVGGVVFVSLYVLHKLLQGAGPQSGSATDVAAYHVARKGVLVGSEVAVGLALLAFLVFLAPLPAALWRAGEQTPATAVLLAGGAFTSIGLVSLAAESTLIAVAGSGEPAAVLALHQLQGRVPVVGTIAALAGALSWAALRTGLWWRWLGVVGLAATAFFLLGFVFSILGDGSEGGSSLYGAGVFAAWMLAVCAGLWRAADPHS